MKNVVITGSSRGLGLSMAKLFLKAGCNVTVSGRSENSFDTARKELSEFSSHVLYMPCNVKVKEDLENLWAQSAAKWGRVDIWINNAGQNCPYEFVYNTDPDYVDAVIDANIRGMIHGSQIAAKNMLTQGGGQIWNMEGLGSNGMIQEKTVLYGTSKRALAYFTMGLAKELKGTPVLAGRLSPGMMLTEFMTKSPAGEVSPVLQNKSFVRIFNILADTPETVADYLVPRILRNTKNNAHIVWPTNSTTLMRFTIAPFHKRKMI